MYDSEGKDNSTSSESNFEFLPCNNFNQDNKVITSLIESKSNSFQQNDIDERGRKRPTLRKSNRALSQQTKIDDKVSKTKFPTHEPTEIHAKYYTESEKSTDLRKVDDKVSKGNSLSSEPNLSTTDVKHAIKNVESTDLREKTDNTSSTMPFFTLSPLHNDDEPGNDDSQLLIHKVSIYNFPLSKSNLSTTTDAKYTTESVESTDLRKETDDQITPAVDFDITSADESNTLQHSVPQGNLLISTESNSN